MRTAACEKSSIPLDPSRRDGRPLCSRQWHLLPQCYPNYKTVHRRLQQWCQREVLREILTQLANTLREEGTIDERESFIDATFARRRAAAMPWGSRNAARA